MRGFILELDQAMTLQSGVVSLRDKKKKSKRKTKSKIAGGEPASLYS